MKTDLYTKIVLTIIAVCLAVLAFNSLTPPAEAQYQLVDVNVAKIGGLSPGTNWPIPVTIE